MAKYLLKASYTAEGAKGVLKDGGTKRREAAQKAIESVGGSVDAFYFAFGSDDAVAMIFAGMQAAFVPARAQNFTGAIQYELEVNGSVHTWAMTIADGAARAMPGAADSPKLVVRAPLPVFLRVAAGELNGGLALMEGKIKLKGDLDVAARLGEMFGDQPRY